jgi:hypothetical protein
MIPDRGSTPVQTLKKYVFPVIFGFSPTGLTIFVSGGTVFAAALRIGWISFQE